VIRIRLAALLAIPYAGVLAIPLAGCRSASHDATPATAAPSTVRADPPPSDHLAEGELLESEARAFDLRLPQGLRVEGSFADVVFAGGPLSVHPLVQYFRPRLVGGDLREGETSATFQHVQVATKPGRQLMIHIVAGRRETRVEVRDETRPPAPNLPNEAARWRAVGLTPDGHLIDPTHLD
jgi:hypothetical protein